MSDEEEAVDPETEAAGSDSDGGEKKTRNKDKKAKKNAKGGAEPGPEQPRIFSAREDERAMIGIRRAKGYGGLAGFGVTAVTSYLHGELLPSLLLRALVGGFAGYLVAWLAAVTVWRRIIRAELHHSFKLAVQARQNAAPGEPQ